MTAPQNDPKIDAEALFSPNFLSTLGEGCITCFEEEKVMFPSSIAHEPNVRLFYRAIFLGTESSYKIDDWLTCRDNFYNKECASQKNLQDSWSVYTR